MTGRKSFYILLAVMLGCLSIAGCGNKEVLGNPNAELKLSLGDTEDWGRRERYPSFSGHCLSRAVSADDGWKGHTGRGMGTAQANGMSGVRGGNGCPKNRIYTKY